MARLKEPCSHCGQEASVAIGQAIITGDELVWSRGIKCEHCGSVKEFDDSGFPPSVYRNALRVQHGTWGVTVMSPEHRSKVAAVVRDIFELSLRDALAFSRKIPGQIWRGTECEATWLQRHLARKGVAAVIDRVDDETRGE
jgi:DNA-directed RNA polymerase subunit RPC12/RpoP